MSRKIKVSAVSYLNTKPLLYGIERHPVREQMILDVAYPAMIAERLKNDSTDIGLVSTAALLSIPNARIIADYGIAASGPVASVCIYSMVPIEQLKGIYLDYQSRTSVRLAEILLKKYWQLDIQLLPAPENFIDLINEQTGAVIIGDRALQANSRFPYVYDLSEHWKAFTGLDFVFAAWIANKDIPQDFMDAFNTANALGVAHIDEVIKEQVVDFYDMNHYFKQNIKYHLDESKREGLELFLKYLREDF